jgi:hypothetical protein
VPAVQVPGAPQLVTAHAALSFAPPEHLLTPAVHVALDAHLSEGSLLQRRLSIWPAPACGFAIGPATGQLPQGRLVAAQLTSIVTSPLVMIGERCEMPLKPVSRRLSAAFASPLNVT